MDGLWVQLESLNPCRRPKVKAISKPHCKPWQKERETTSEILRTKLNPPSIQILPICEFQAPQPLRPFSLHGEAIPMYQPCGPGRRRGPGRWMGTRRESKKKMRSMHSQNLSHITHYERHKGHRYERSDRTLRTGLLASLLGTIS